MDTSAGKVRGFKEPEREGHGQPRILTRALATSPALPVESALELVSAFLLAPLAGITESCDDHCILVAISNSSGLALELGAAVPTDQSTCSVVARTNEPLVIPDLLEQKTRFPLMAGMGIRGFAAVPLSLPGEPPFGTLWIGDVKPRELTDQELKHLLHAGELLTDGLLRARAHQNSLQRYAHVVESMRESVVITDLEGNIRHVNPAVERLHGWTPDELKGKHFSQFGIGLIPPELERKILQDSLSGGFSGRVPNRRSDGREITVELRTSLIKDEMGTPYMLAGISHDVTEELKAEVVRLETAQRLQALVQSSVDGILMIDQNQIVVAINRRFGELFAVDASSALGKADTQLRKEAHRSLRDPAEFERQIQDIYSRPAVHLEMEFELVWPEFRVVHCTHSPVLAPDGEEMGRLWIASDVTTSRRLDQELRESKAQVEESDRLKSEFLATTSHELRTPLNSILGFLKLVLEDACSGPEEERSLLNHAYKTGAHLGALLNDILDLAKIETGKVQLELTRVDVRPVIDELWPIISVQAKEKGLDLVFDDDRHLPGFVQGDYQRIKQVLLNLLGNSVKYTPTGSIRLEMLPGNDGESLLLRVRDTGIGFDMEQLRRIREGHVQKSRGGIGLSIARRFVDLMGGRLDIESPGLGGGATVTLSLPLSTAKENGNSASEAAPNQGQTAEEPRRIRILVVEDDEASALAVQLTLERLGEYAVETTDDVPLILDRTRSGEIDAVLMDVSLQRSSHEDRAVDGLEITRMLKADPRTSHLPVILMTAHAMAGDRERFLASSGADDYEAKPIFDFKAMMARLQGLIQQSRHRHSPGK